MMGTLQLAEKGRPLPPEPEYWLEQQSPYATPSLSNTKMTETDSPGILMDVYPFVNGFPR